MNFSKNVKRTALSVALGMCVAGGVQAQSTTGGIYGNAPAGSSITVTSASGFSRTITVGADGRYNFSNLPIGTYVVDAGATGKQSVIVPLGGAVAASFTDNATTLTTVTVNGNSVPKIDVTSTSTSTVITAQQLQRLPLAHNAESIALLSPGAVMADTAVFKSNHGNSVSFGGSSAGENAYYINGFFSGTPTTNVGGYTLPYGAIEQQETYTGGYSARFGRSDGGVINQVGKSGTNDLHFGGQVTFEPKGMHEGQPSEYFHNGALSGADSGYEYNPSDIADTAALAANCKTTPAQGLDGCRYTNGKDSKSWTNTYSGYIGGPIIKDKLFAFVAAEADKSDSYSTPSVLGTGGVDSSGVSNGLGEALHDHYNSPSIYAKLNWNINDSNLLEYTYMSRRYSEGGYYSNYDASTWTDEGSNGKKYTNIQENDEYSIFKYTSYITDNLTFTGTYGRSREHYSSSPGSLDGDAPYISGASLEDPSITGGTAITNSVTGYKGVDSFDYTHGLRLELRWVLGDHTLTGGIDNQYFGGESEGSKQLTDLWVYHYTASPAANISTALGVGAPGSNYYVSKYVYQDATDVSTRQKAFYLEDQWQITDNFLLTLGLRNDKFDNYNALGQSYVQSGNQWAPRIGGSWDVFGDSSLKIFANAGRYFLAMPMDVAVRSAGGSLYTNEYYTYTGIAADGTPTGLTDVKNTAGTGAAGAVSSDGEIGQSKDPNTIAATNLKSEYQDEYILGFEKTLGAKWKYGAKATYRDLKSGIDDVCSPGLMETKLAQNTSLTSAQLAYADASIESNGCFLINPQSSNTFKVPTSSGEYTSLTMTRSDWGWTVPFKRTYKALDAFIEHPWDGKWEARVDVTWGKSYGDDEGPANSDTGQGGAAAGYEHDNGISTSENWDGYGLMENSVGYLPNDRRWQFKVHGSYALNDSWAVSANALVQAGTPIDCYGMYVESDGTESTGPEGYGAAYHFCYGQASNPGKERSPWIHRYDLGLSYAPVYFDHKVKFAVNVFNAFNERHATAIYGYSEADIGTADNFYGTANAYENPRYVMFSASFDY